MSLRFETTILIFVLLFFKGFSQEDTSYNYEIELGTDNDYFIVYTGTDRNYTYGINANLRWKPEQIFLNSIFKNTKHHYHSLGLKIEGYTPNYLDKDEPDIPNIERPFAGWSYLNYVTAYTFEKSFVSLGIDLGILGPSSQVGQLQNWIHEHITDDETIDWSEQIPNQLGINIRTTYAHKLYGVGWLDAYVNTELSIGNIFTYLKPQLNFRLGKFNSITESIVLNNSLLAPKQNTEIFLEYGVGFKLSAYNATVQGNFFGDGRNRDNTINNTIFSMHLGLNVTLNRWGMTFKYNFGTGEFDKTQVHCYGALRFFYRFN